MATGRQNKFAYDRRYYESRYSSAVEGNAARQLAEEEYEEEYYTDEELYDEEYEEEDFYGVAPETTPQQQNEAETGRRVVIKKKYNFNFITTVMLVIAVCALLYNAYQYLAVQSQINVMTKQLSVAKAELEDVTAINASLKNRLDVDVDRNMIYSLAVSKFNMQYPNENQTVYYEKPDSGYVRQYQKIPTV